MSTSNLLAANGQNLIRRAESRSRVDQEQTERKLRVLAHGAVYLHWPFPYSADLSAVSLLDPP